MNNKNELNFNNKWDEKKIFIFQLAGNIIVILLISPEEFLRNAQAFLFTLSQKLRGAVHIRMINDKPMIYSWSSEGGIGPLYDVPQEKRHLLIPNYQRNKRQSNFANLYFNFLNIIKYF